MKVYQAIGKVMSELVKVGISKADTNTFDNYKFRGIDAVYNSLAPLLATHGLCFLPRVMNCGISERQAKDGKPMFHARVDMEFDLVCAEDDSKHTVAVVGEALDRGDKCVNKAMSAAFKYAAFQTFCIPTVGDNDADASTHELESGLINSEMVKELDGLIAEVGADKKKFLRYLQVSDLAELPAASYASAREALEAKRKPVAA